MLQRRHGGKQGDADATFLPVELKISLFPAVHRDAISS